MNLPAFLASDDGGFIHLAGHRIGLNHVLRHYNEGYSPEMLACQFPSLRLALVHRIIAFYLENQAEVDAYMAAQVQEVSRQMALPRTAPTLAELRARLDCDPV